MNIVKRISRSSFTLWYIFGVALLLCYEIRSLTIETTTWHEECPYACVCYDNYTDVDCSNSSLYVLPTNIPRNTKQL